MSLLNECARAGRATAMHVRSSSTSFSTSSSSASSQPLFRATPLALALFLALPAMAQQTAATLPNVTVTATMAEHDVRTAPASVSVVDRKELDARMPADLMEAIQDEPGVGFDVISTAGRKTLSLRGMESKHILMMIDGKRIAGSDDVVGHSDYWPGWVPMVAVERVE